jgi:hypothetical protein
MKALSLLQPWASLVVMGLKTIETRSWSTNFRGELLIHASNGKAGEILANDFPFKKHIPDFKKLPFGSIIGKVILRDVIRIKTGEMFGMNDESINRLTFEEKAFGDYSEGRFAWIFEEAIQFQKTYPAKGSLILWNIDFRESDIL